MSLAFLTGILSVPAPAASADLPPFTWSAPTNVDGIAPIRAVSCTTSPLCVTGDSGGFVTTSTDPTGGAEAWTYPEWVDESEPYGGPEGHATSSMSCVEAPSRLCLGADESGNVISSTNPTGGLGAWHLVTPMHTGVFIAYYADSCPSSSLCIVVGEGEDGGVILSSTSPTGGAWKRVVPESEPEPGVHHPYGAFRGASCPSTSMCVVVGEGGKFGDVFTSMNPTGSASTWKVAGIGDVGLTAVSCPSTSLCVAVQDHAVYTSTDPIAGATSWTETEVDPGGEFTAISCTDNPSLLCVAVDNAGNAVTSTDPLGGTGAWTVTPADGEAPLISVSCPSTSLCVAGDQAANVITSAGPAGSAGRSGTGSPSGSGGAGSTPPSGSAPGKGKSPGAGKKTKCRKGFRAKEAKSKEICVKVKKRMHHKRRPGKHAG